ncbi:MAG TPA: response regulator, partial [Polyangiaceae bacterium]|nr:response regulator [Polyangiaceae bacterium]
TPDFLLVDDDERFRERLLKAFRQRGLEAEGARDAEQALALVRLKRFRRALIDLRMPGHDGLSLLRALLEHDPELYVVVLTGFGSIATAVEAMQLGARNYLTKPCDADRILAAFSAEPAAEGQEPVFETPSLARIEREHIERVLRECSGNISKTARVLGIHRRTLQYKLAKFPVNR